MSPWVRTHREDLPLRAFLEKEPSGGQWEPSALGVGQGEEAPWSTCAAPPALEMGSQPRGSEATVPCHSTTCIISAPSPTMYQAQAQTCFRESLKRSPPLWVGTTKERQASQSGCSHQTLGWGHVQVAQSPQHPYCVTEAAPRPRGRPPSPLSPTVPPTHAPSCSWKDHTGTSHGPHSGELRGPTHLSSSSFLIPQTHFFLSSPSAESFFYSFLSESSWVTGSGPGQGGLRDGTVLFHLQELTVRWER